MAKSNQTTRKTSSASAPQDNTPPPAQHETLLNDGLAFQRKSQVEAQQRLHEATERLSHLATDFGQQATGRVDKLEHLFEDRVAKALHRLGMPTLLDIQMLTDRVALLESQWAAALKTPPASAKKTPNKAATRTAAKVPAQTSGKIAAPKAAKTPAKKTRSKSV